MDFGRPNAEIGRKMANGRLLFLALGGTLIIGPSIIHCPMARDCTVLSSCLRVYYVIEAYENAYAFMSAFTKH